MLFVAFWRPCVSLLPENCSSRDVKLLTLLSLVAVHFICTSHSFDWLVTLLSMGWIGKDNSRSWKENARPSTEKSVVNIVWLSTYKDQDGFIPCSIRNDGWPTLLLKLCCASGKFPYGKGGWYLYLYTSWDYHLLFSPQDVSIDIL